MCFLSKKSKNEELKSEYTDLTPVDDIENGEEYLHALKWAFDNKRIKNIALTGHYGAGKSSIIQTFFKRNPKVEKKALRISMATFFEVERDGEKKGQKTEFTQENPCRRVWMAVQRRFCFRLRPRLIWERCLQNWWAASI